MDEKQRVARIRLTKSSSPPENAAGENPPVFPEGSPGENLSQEALSFQKPGNVPTPGTAAGYPSFPTDRPSTGDISFPAGDTGEVWEDSEEAWQEDEETEETEEQAFWLAEKKRILFNALFILGILYVICGVIPLILPFFVPLRVFVWTEVVGWIIIIAWLLIGVRKPLLEWMKVRAETKKEQAA